MKKILISILITVALLLVLMPGLTRADDFDIAVSSLAVAGVVPGADITGPIKIDMITLTNSGTTVQVVTLYELGASSSTISSRMVVDVPSNAVDGPIIIPWPYHNPMIVTDFTIRRSAAASTINAYILYR